MTPEQIAAERYNREFSLLNPQIPYNAKAEPVGYMNYLKQLLRDQAIRGGNSYKDPTIPSPSTPAVVPQPTVGATDWGEVNEALLQLQASVVKLTQAVSVQIAKFK